MANKVKQIQKVKIREKQNSDNKVSLYLDWYDGNGKRTKEYLGLSIFIKPKNDEERKANKDNLIKAETIRTDRQQQYFNNTIDEILKNKKLPAVVFLQHFKEYIENYKLADKRVMRAVYGQLESFMDLDGIGKDLPASQVTQDFCNDFKTYLDNALQRESPKTYFQRFKKYLNNASNGRDRIFRESPAKNIVHKQVEKGNEKDILTIEELRLLINTDCGNEEVKRAFLFCCNTGLRQVDAQQLKWKNIKQETLEIKQAKTGEKLKMVLNDNAKRFLIDRGNDEEAVFKLPSTNATNKNLKNWAKRAGLDKHITFYSSRHTFGTLLAYHSIDILMIGELLGHTSTKHTKRYIRIAEEMKKKAVDVIPNF